ncbi:MAG: hypothetical protein ACRCW2_16140 [Cellulosilyticaceae bacterium]
MKRLSFKKGLILIMLFVCMGIGTVGLYAKTSVDITTEIKQINNIRNQFMGIVEQGYYNHFNGKSNRGNVEQVRVYLKQIEPIRNELRAKQANVTDKIERRNITTLIATGLYLQDMGDNLIDYLEAEEQKDQYSYFSTQLQINQFIINILGTVADTIG